MDIPLIIITLLSLAIFVFMYFSYNVIKSIEKKDWNKGKCPICGEKWRLREIDADGRRLYKCKNNHKCEITHHIDK